MFFFLGIKLYGNIIFYIRGQHYMLKVKVIRESFLEKTDLKPGYTEFGVVWIDSAITDSGVHTLGDNSDFVNPAGQLLLTRRVKTRMDGVAIVFELYIAPL